MYHLQTDQLLNVAAEQAADRMRASERGRMARSMGVETAGRSRAARLRAVFAVSILAGMLALWAMPLLASHTPTHLAQPSYSVPQGYFIQEKMYRPPAAMEISPGYGVPAGYFVQEKAYRAPATQAMIASGFSVPADYFMHEKTDR